MVYGLGMINLIIEARVDGTSVMSLVCDLCTEESAFSAPKLGLGNRLAICGCLSGCLIFTRQVFRADGTASPHLIEDE